mgnify:CR=1 FL=1
MIGKNSLIRFDHLTRDAGIPALIALKIFLGGAFDYIAYVTGLTKITLKDFVKVNILAGIPSTFLMYLIFLYSKDITSGLIISYLVGIALTIFWVIFNHKTKHQ